MSAPENLPASSDSSPQNDSFHRGALQRIRRDMLCLGVAAPVIACFWLGWRIAAGLACGCLVAYINFQWLVRGVEGVAARMADPESARSGKGIVSRFLLRYLLMAAAAYGILSVSRLSLYGLLAGLFLPVAAIACEAAYELYAALTRGL